MEKYIEKNKPGTFTPYHEAAENLTRKLSILERLVPSAQDRAQLAMAIRVKNARCNNPEALVVRTLSVLHLQTAPLTLDEAVFALDSLVENEGAEVMNLPDQQLANKIAQTAFAAMQQVLDEYTPPDEEPLEASAVCVGQIKIGDYGKGE